MWLAIARWLFVLFARDLVLEYALQIVATVVVSLVLLVMVLAWSIAHIAQPGGIYWLAAQAAPEVQAQHPLPSARPSGGFDASLPALPLEPFIGPVAGGTLPPPPAEQWALMQQVARGAGGCSFDPVWLAAIAFYESSYGQNPGPSSAGAWGYGQFMPETLAAYRISREQALDFRVMLPAMATYLCRAGIASSVDAALYAYNHSQAYVEWVKYLASTWFRSALPAWTDGPAWNQYDPRSYRSSEVYQAWHAADCSAASLAWMLRAYGQPVPYLDDAIALLGGAISPDAGLLDHRGPALAAALGARGLSAWNGHLASTQALVDKLHLGPVLLDGQRWFGVGHWFVAIGSDPSGITVRESSGHDVTHLTWDQLYGPVGWSGWAVGVLVR
jgi:hypothetical protein